MYLPQNDISEVVLRQRNKKDDLSAALAKNKAKVTQVLKDIRILTQPFNSDFVSEMKDLDDEIEKLRRICHDMANRLNEMDNGNRANAIAAEQRQPVRPAPPPPPQAPPRARPYNLFASLPTPAARSPISPQSPASQHSQTPSPVCQASSAEQSPLQPKVIDENDSTDPSCGEQPWECSMCTFQNHPLLKKCECCDNVRILPGTVRIVPSNPPIRPSLGPCTRSEPPTPATPASGPPSARLFTSLSTDSNNHPPVPNNINIEGNLIMFTNDVII